MVQLAKKAERASLEGRRVLEQRRFSRSMEEAGVPNLQGERRAAGPDAGAGGRQEELGRARMTAGMVV